MLNKAFAPRPEPVYRLFSRESLSQVPSSEQALIAGALIERLQVTDLRYDLWVYGPVFKDLPRLLGSNAALDACASVLVSALPPCHSERTAFRAQQKYVGAVRMLRKTLDDPAHVGDSSTLFAIYLLIITQVNITLFHYIDGRHD